MNGKKISLRLALGILCGIALVLLPGVFSTGPPTTSTSDQCSTCAGSLAARSLTEQFGSTANPSNGTPSSAGLSFLAIVLFIFLPSTVFSVLVRRWAEMRANARVPYRE